MTVKDLRDALDGLPDTLDVRIVTGAKTAYDPTTVRHIGAEAVVETQKVLRSFHQGEPYTCEGNTAERFRAWSGGKPQ